MGFLTDLTLSKSKLREDTTHVEPVSIVTPDAEKGVESNIPSVKGNDNATFTTNAQAGVKRVEAATIVWTKWHLVGAYVM